MVFPVIMYGCESWTIKKAECRRIDAFELWCWRRLLRVPWTARRSNQSILKEISPEYSLEGLVLKLKLQYFGHLMRRDDLLEKTLILGKIEGRRRRGWQRISGEDLSERNQSWIFIGRTDTEAETPILEPPDAKSWLTGKDLDAGKDWGQEEKDDRGWDGWMASPAQWTWVWVDSGSWWWTRRPGMLRFMGSQRVGHDWVIQLTLMLICRIV